MTSQKFSLSAPGISDRQETIEHNETAIEPPGNPPEDRVWFFKNLSPFWHDRFIECALIVSLALYYVTGNVNLGKGALFHLSPLLALPFLLIFAILCWYRLNFALALLPLALPYYLIQKTVYSHYAFGIAEIALAVCVVVFLLQLVFQRERWPVASLWRDMRAYLGPFALPILVFFLAAAFSIANCLRP